MNCRQIISGELHYPRIPREYWTHRLAMARAMGLNTISTYVFWNRHERMEGSYDFSGGNDVAAFVREAQAAGLDVLLRPGPYVCAEWDFGGLPAWLLRDEALRVRTTDERFMAPVRRWLHRLGDELAPLQRSRGGPIVAVQLENEYGAFGSDAAYLRALREILIESGFGESPHYTIDQPGDLRAGALDELPIATTFGPGEPHEHLRRLRELRPQAPLLCGEYWAGWFDHWGEPHETRDDAQQIRDLEWMLANGAFVNIYMLHGGTNFGFWNGANAVPGRPYQPTTTSYDYDAAIDEAGRPREKYFGFRDAIARHTSVQPPEVPDAPRVVDLPPVRWHAWAPMQTAFGETVRSERPQPMERFGHDYGYAVYRTQLHGPGEGELEIDELRDYGVVMLDGRCVARLDRRLGENRTRIACGASGATLEILVENGGRMNYGAQFAEDRKGITRAVRWRGEELRGWEFTPMLLQSGPPAGGFSARKLGIPAFRRGTIELLEAADSFLDTSGLGKGTLWINGNHAGRYWNIGPQLRLYVPAAWLHPGKNEIVVFEVLDEMSEAK